MNLSVNWVLQVDNIVYKFLNKIPRKDAERILIVVNNLSNDPFYGDIKKMKGEENSWRRRTGAYRIFYEIIPQEKTVYVFKIERRTSKTY